jgi:UPF0755 protein
VTVGFAKGLSRIVVVAIAGIAVIALSGLFAFMFLEAPPPVARRGAAAAPGIAAELDGSFVVVVHPGESASAVGRRLQAAGIIRSALLWTILARIDADKVKAGTYRVDASRGALAVRELLVSGKQLLVKVTVPEGYTLKKTAALLEAAGVVAAGAFLDAAAEPELLRTYGIPGRSFEGYLYPDTYLFPKDYPAERVVRAMADTFFSRLQALAPKPLSEYAPEELFEKVTLASIVEREYRVDDEAPLIAGVFENRLRIGMALQSCATVEYVITEIQGKPHPDVLYNKDIAIRDPYNTYVNAGLPPGPISSPGRVALEAAFKPAPSGFLYFRLADPAEGRHRFSRTLDEHVKAGVLYVKSVKKGS